MNFSFDAYFDELDRKRAARSASAVALDQSSPDDMAEAMRVGEELGVPANVVRSAPEVFKRRATQQRNTTFLQGAPRLSEWVREPVNAAIAKDDLENLAWFEKGLKDFALAGKGLSETSPAIGAPMRGAARMGAIPSTFGAMASGQLAADVGRSYEDILQEELGEYAQVGERAPAQIRVAAMEAARLRFERAQSITPEQRREIVRQGADQLVRSREILDRAEAIPRSQAAESFMGGALAEAENSIMGVLNAFVKDPAGGAAFVAETAAEFLPALLVASGVTAVTRSTAAGSLAMGGQSGLIENATGAMDFLAEKGVDISTPEAALAAIEDAELMAEARDRGLARGLVIGVMDALSGGIAGQTLMRNPVGDMTAQAIAQVLFGAGGEAGAQVVAGQEVDWRDIVIEGLAELATLPVEVLGVGGRRFFGDAARSAGGGGTGETLNRIDDMASRSKVKERAPQKFLEATTASGLGEQFLYVPADALNTFYQSGIDDATLAGLGLNRADFEEMVASGGDVAIPLSHYAANISGTDAAQFFHENGRLDPDGMSQLEAALFQSEAGETLQGAMAEAEQAIQEGREVAAADQEIYDAMATQLREAGRTPGVADQEARVWAAFWRTMGARYGADPRELAGRFGVAIRGQEQAGAPLGADVPADTAASETGAMPARPTVPAPPTDVAITAAGREVPVTYKVVDAVSLVTSQTDDGRANPAFPAELQPRDRSRDTSMEQIRRIAQNLDPRLLGPMPSAADGAPIVNASGVVESGNGRVLAIRQAYANNPDRASAYRAFVEGLGYSTEGMAAPVLVRERTADMTPEEQRAFTREANERSSMDLSDTERAMADAAAMPDSALGLYQGGDVDLAQNRDFVRAFMMAAVNANDQGSFIDAEGRMSQRAVRRVQAALLGKAYGDASLVESVMEVTDGNIKSIGGALMDVAPVWAQMRREAENGTISAEMDQTAALLEAVNMVRRARDEGRPVSEFVGQTDIFSGEAMSPMAEGFLRLFFRDVETLKRPAGRAKVAEALTFYVEEAQKAAPGVDLLGESADPQAIIEAAKARQYEDPDAQPRFFAQSAYRIGVGFLPRGAEGDGATASGAEGTDGEAGGGSGAETAAGAAQELRRPGRIVRLQDLDDTDAVALERALRQGQGFASVDEVMARGAVNHEALTEAIAEAAEAVGARAKAAPLKGRARVEEKVATKYAGDPNRITDVARGGIDALTLDQADEFIARMAERFSLVDEGWIVTEEGYFDRKIAVVFSDGQLGEIQIWPPGMLEAKEERGGHKHYEAYRSPASTEPEKLEAKAAMLDLYGQVAASLDPSWSGILPPSAVTAASTRDLSTSGDLSSRYTSEGEMLPQELSSPSSSMSPDSVSMAGMDPSTMKNRMVEPPVSNQDIAANGGNSNSDRTLFQADQEFAAYHAAKAEADRLLDEVKSGGDAAVAFEAFAETGRRRDELAAAIAAEDGGIELASGNGLFAAVTRSQAVPDGWRVTFFNDTGFLGHTEQPTKLAAVQQALDEGYTTEAQGALRTAMQKRSFFQKYLEQDMARGSIQFPRGGLSEGQTIISLFETADLSTFLHESGHFFLEAFTALATDPIATEEMRADLATIRKFLGAKEGEAYTTDMHETWARGFEAYLMEGKAPSLELADAFARFKAWLVRIYKSVRGLNVTLNDDIRGVMDRMLATDAEIAAARESVSMEPLFRTSPPGMSEHDWQVYQRMARRGQEQAEQTLLAKTMERLRREKEAWYRAEKKAVRAQVSERTNAQPVYRLIEALANGKWIGNDDADIPDMRIDRQALVDEFGEGVLADLDRKKLGGRRAIYGPDGSTPGEVAEFFGFEDAGAMIEALRGAQKRKDAIEQEVDRIMVERYGDPFEDGRLEEEALSAIHSVQQEKATVAEARHLARQLGRDTRNMTARIYRQRARLMIGRMTVAQASRPAQFLQAERRAARAAQDAFAKVVRGGGRDALAAAFQAKEQQVLNQHLYQEARKVEDEVSKGRERMMRYNRKTVRQKLDGGYIEQIDAILADYDFRVRSRRQVERQESLKAFIDRMVADGREAELNIDTRMLSDAHRKHYSRLSVDELRGLFDTIANIDHMGRRWQKLTDARRSRDLAQTVGRVTDQIRKSQKIHERDKKRYGLQALNLLRRPDTILIALDGGKEMGPLYEELKLDIDRGQATEQKMQVEMAERMDVLFREHYTPAQLREMQKPRQVVTNGRQWSKAEIVSVALNTGNEENFKRLMDPNAAKDSVLTPRTLEVLLNEMTENDWRFVQAMWDEINSYWPELAAIHKRRTGTEPVKVEPKLMVNAPPGVRGGYYPIKYDSSRGKKAAQDEASAWDRYVTAGHGSTTAVANGMTKQRQKSGGGRTLLFDLSVPFQHLRETIRYIALSEAVDNAYRVLNHHQVFEAMQETGNADTLKTLNLWLQDTARGPIFNTDLLNTVSRAIKNNFTLSRLAFNLKTIVLQATGLGQSAATIGKRNMVRGMVAYARRPMHFIEDVTARSPFMAERQSTFQKDIYDFVNDTKTASPLTSRYRKAKGVAAKAGFWPIVKMQFLVVDMPTWLGAYDAALRQFKGDEERAVAYADRMVARAQDSGLFADRAGIERGTVSENIRQADFIRLFTTLAGYMLTKLNRAQVTAIQARLNMREADSGVARAGIAVGAATDMMLLFVFEAAMMGLIYALMTDEEDDEDLMRFMLEETGMAMVGGIPMVRDAASAFRGYGGGGVYGSVMEVPARAITQVLQGENDSALRRSIADVIGLATGLPSTASIRLIEGILDSDAAPAEALFGTNPLTR